ncbi:hypothetical protein [Noviherbaspirillum saxi]|uniref:Uncharacterized protein n=1 Tax=Noviherbaspirillum saxi TaxID=2320863 RepID=A0A3A3FU54_9BURK|nr:hypothetical protein [Noviherbaspirillum saxi]RJF99070.1 hypothetical protein D3871_11500 [Noviherbaspirillum saxi]
MPKFTVTAIFTASKHLGEFEAATEQEAIDMALGSQKNYASLCHQCSDEVELDDHCAHQAVAHLSEDTIK